MSNKFLLILIVITIITLLFALFPLFKLKRYKTAFISILLFPILSFSLYAYWGHGKEWLRYFSFMQQVKNPNQVVAHLKEYLATHPDSPKGWFLLGQIELKSGNYESAVEALAKAHQEAPDQIDYSTSYAEALFFSHNQTLTKTALALIDSVLKQDNKNVAANNLLAINAYRQGRYQVAINYWQKLLPLFETHSKDEKILLQMISDSRAKLHRNS